MNMPEKYCTRSAVTASSVLGPSAMRRRRAARNRASPANRHRHRRRGHRPVERAGTSEMSVVQAIETAPEGGAKLCDDSW
jgi:hypothetical protein